MSRVATITLLYTSDLSRAKAEYQAYKEWVESNPPRIGGQFTGFAGARGPSTTFSGTKTESGLGSAAVAPPPGASTAAYTDVASAAAESATRRTVQALVRALPASGGGVEVSPGYRSTASIMASAWARPAATGSTDVASFFGEDAGINAAPGGGGFLASMFPTFMGAGGASLFSRAGFRSALGGEGLRGLGRYFAAFGIAEMGSQFLQQQNRYAIGRGGATTAGDFIQQDVQYQQNSPWASIPLVGQLGSGLREWWTGDQAHIASVQTTAGLTNQNTEISQDIEQRRLSTRAMVAEASGTYAGRRSAVDFTAQAAVKQAKDAATKRIDDLSETISTLVGDGTAVLSKDDQAKLDAMKGQLQAVKHQRDNFVSTESVIAAAQKDVIGREEMSAAISSEYEVRAMGMADVRASRRERIRGQAAARLALTQDPETRRQIIAERAAALDADSRETGADRITMDALNRSREQAVAGNMFAASEFATDAHYDEMVRKDPSLAMQYNRSRSLEHQANALDASRSRIRTYVGTERLAQEAGQQALRNQLMPRSADVQSIIDESSDQILQTNMELRGSENAALRQKRIATIELLAKSQIAGITDDPRVRYSGRGVQVSPWLMNPGDPGNLAFRDYVTARTIGPTAMRAFDAAAAIDPQKLPGVAPGGGGSTSLSEIINVLRTEILPALKEAAI